MTLSRPTKVVCVGRNYRAHAAELGNEVPDEPLIFLKPPSAIVGDGEEIKGFDTFCPLGSVVPISEDARARLRVVTRVNGEPRQEGHVEDMAFGIPFLVSYVSRIMTWEPGDVLATGTPEGVGPLVPGDVVEVEIPGIGVLSNPVTGEIS